MTKERKAQILTGVLMAGALGFAAYRKGAFASMDWSRLTPPVQVKTEQTPQDVIYGMLDAARDGKVTEYLSFYTGQMEELLRKSIAEQGEAAFAKYLRDTNAPIKGVALQEPQTLTGGEVKVKVEYVFADRNEVQWMYVEKEAGKWKIARVDSSERIKTLVPYGTPVQ
jgi:hypothetical protein